MSTQDDMKLPEPAFWTRKPVGADREICEKPFTMDWQALYTEEQMQAVIAECKADAERWQYARQFLAVEDIEKWSGEEWAGHVATECGNRLADEAVDAALTKQEGAK